MSTPKAALEGIRVIDMSRVFAAPVGAQILGDLGADVIKVERPGVGDDGRGYGFSWVPGKDGIETRHSSFFTVSNRNKRSITLNHSRPEGQAILRDLVKNADVLIENYKVGDLKRFGLDYESLRAINPGLIYCSVTGFGQTGPMAALPGYDGLFQATGGMMAVTGIPEGQPGSGPLKTGPSLVDFVTGHNTALAILGALMHRTRSGEGQYIDIALLDSSVAMVSHIMQDYLISGNAPPRLGNGGNGGGPADLIHCADGIIYLTAGTDEHWRRLTVLMDQPELNNDPRFDSNLKRGKTNRAELMAIINDWSGRFPTLEVQAMLDGVGIPAARYNELADVWEDPQVQHRGLKATTPHAWAESGSVDLIASPLAKMSASPATIRMAPPMLGEHTDAILSELGYDEAQVAALRDAKVV
ncbi:putative acyl-CoA transferase/carnitine dehydratase precursor [Novosphingobium resinovorum]|jgi:crotonobetainyl-CoA:carnitine CoA-transferase CaiB-like acyl-CoA transferase|uniref:Putative acyl-CoA transferase/carnitine dehydratase n=1 Tax=Novosphingobium resinovorum TaxID=158500 RepID=A0A031K7C0_9SPHN|nr:CaiB/BaiF CoA-transferase family protein [Novosphingobium resinovorum]EZP84517.1 putative acyl-CoA transferase/carnitine dehydratase precursor [Novosphingobium resinovorum]